MKTTTIAALTVAATVMIANAASTQHANAAVSEEPVCWPVGEFFIECWDPDELRALCKLIDPNAVSDECKTVASQRLKSIGKFRIKPEKPQKRLKLKARQSRQIAKPRIRARKRRTSRY